MDGRDADQILDDLFEDVGLDRSLIRRYPHELSGGQQQKVGIARAIATGPDLVVLDEPTSSLDSVARAELIDLLRRLQQEHDVAYLFITHDLTVAQHFAHEVAVMYLGKIVEIGDARKVFRDPQHPYSQALLSAALAPEPGGRGSLITLEGEIPSPIQLPEGCHFCSRCPVSEPSCRDGFPGLESVSSGHSVACYRAGTSIRG
jgi:oligopeptide/dipeptide ABC transporter ATP-binding protein